MTYTQDIPLSGDSLGGTRARINTNFQEIFNVNGINHVDFNDSGEGKHKFLQMPITGANFNNNTTPPSTGTSEGALYVKDDSGGDAQLFYREESNGSERQLTGGTVATEGSVPLPGGLILKWGTKSSPGTSGSVTFSTAFPTAIFQIQLTLAHPNQGNVSAAVRLANTPPPGPSVTGFEYFSSSSNANALYWVALGN